MEFDIRTIAILVVITHFIQVVVFTIQYKTNKGYNGIGWWLLWSCFLAFGMTLFISRIGEKSNPFIITAQNILIISSTLFVYIGIMEFLGKKVNKKFIWIYSTLFLASFFYFLFIDNNIKYRSFFINLALSVIAFYTAFNLYKHKIKSFSTSANFLVFTFLAHALIFLFISYQVLFYVSDFVLYLPYYLGGLQLLDAIVIGLLWTFGFVMMLNQRLSSEMKESKEHFEQIFNTSPDAAIITNIEDGTVINLNDAYTKITGFSRDETIGKSTFDIHIWKDINDRNEVVKQLKTNGYCDNYEAKFIKKDGTEITGLMSAKIIDLQNVPHIISISRDITERKKTEQKITEQNEMLTRVNSEKDKYFSIIAHDLRSPFSLFLGLTELMSKDLYNMNIEEIKDYINHLNRSANNLYRLLTNLLEWSKIQRGLTAFNPELLNISKIIKEILDVYIDNADQKEIKISTIIPNNLVAFADKPMFETILRNLISNAIKFTPKGGSIDVTAKNIHTNIEITIKDNGIGMNNELLQNIFRINSQTNRKGTENEPSTGLGLLICKEFIAKNNGTLTIKSEENKGSEFTVVLGISK